MLAITRMAAQWTITFFHEDTIGSPTWMPQLQHNTSMSQQWGKWWWMVRLLKLSKSRPRIHSYILSFSVWLWLAEILGRLDKVAKCCCAVGVSKKYSIEQFPKSLIFRQHSSPHGTNFWQHGGPHVTNFMIAQWKTFSVFLFSLCLENNKSYAWQNKSLTLSGPTAAALLVSMQTRYIC